LADGEKSLLKKHYHGALPKDGKEELEQEWWKKKKGAGMTKKSLSRSAQYFLAFADYLASIYVIHQNGANKKKCLCANLVRSFCDLASRFVLKDGQYKSESWVGKVEAVSSAVPHVYDAGNGSYGLWNMWENTKKRFQSVRESFFRKSDGDNDSEPGTCPICLGSKFSEDSEHREDDMIYEQRHCCGYITCSDCRKKTMESCPSCRCTNRATKVSEIKYPDQYLEKDGV